jgi:fructokinase
MRLGIDLGGTKTEIIALDSQGRELLRERRPTPSQSYEAILETLTNLVLSAEQKLGLKGTVGIGIPGALSRATGLVKNANTICLIGKPLDRDLGASLKREVRLANDANCFALSEAIDGAGRGAELVFGVILGTGVGGGIVIRQTVRTGPHAIAGEWGHNPLPWPHADELPGPACYCGKNGCIETFLSGPALHAQGGHQASVLADAALNGDPNAEAVLQRFEDRLARAFATVINILDPDVIVLGGGLSNLERLYQNLPSLLPLYVFSDEVKTRLTRAAHGDSSGVRGAAWLWPEGGEIIR